MVDECLRTGWVSTLGPFVSRFEDELRRVTGAQHVIAMASGTAALHLTLHTLGVGPGDEVIVPALSFVATANAVAHCGGIPHFVDSELETLGLDAMSLHRRLKNIASQRGKQLINNETGAVIKAIVPMHAFGHPCDIRNIIRVADEFGIPVVEDAAESLGSSIAGRHTGTFGTAGFLSFNGNKIVTTGNGGAVLTNDETLAQRLRHLSTTAKRAHAWEFLHDEVAWNYRLPNINAALGCAQLSRLSDLLSRKRRLAARYQSVFAVIESISFNNEPANTASNFWLSTVQLESSDRASRNSVLQAAHDAGYLCRPVWNLLSELPMYSRAPRGDLSVATEIENSVICLPSGPRLLT